MRYRRAIIILLTALILFANLLSPVVDISDSHDHSCSRNRCLICFVSGALQMLQNLVFAATFYRVLFFIILFICSVIRFLPSVRAVSTPIRLKTKILS